MDRDDSPPSEAEDRERARLEREARWLDENRDAIVAYNERVEREGTFGEAFRNL